MYVYMLIYLIGVVAMFILTAKMQRKNSSHFFDGGLGLIISIMWPILCFGVITIYTVAVLSYPLRLLWNKIADEPKTKIFPKLLL